MNTTQKTKRFFIWLGLAFLQLVMTQVVTFLVSLLVIPFGLDMEKFPETHPLLFVIILGITFTAGVFLTGWLALQLRWLKMEPRLPARLVGSFVGAILPLVIALFLYHPLESGNPFFFISMLMTVAGFYVGGWIGGR